MTRILPALAAAFALLAQPTLATDRKPLVIVSGQTKQIPTGDTVPLANGGTGATTAAGARTNLDTQQHDTDLDTYAGITPSANVQTLLGSADFSAFRTSMGTGTGDSPQFTCVNVGNASDTTVCRTAAGTVQVEGYPVCKAIYANGAQALGAADTNENTVRTFTVPANSMGPNGSVKIFTLWTANNDASVKTAKVKFGGTNYTNLALTSTTGAQTLTRITNRNATNSQVGFAVGSAGITTTAAAVTTSAVDTTADVTVLVTAQKADGTDTLGVDSIEAQVCYGA